MMAYGKWCYICKKDISANRLKEHREMHRKEKDKIKKEKQKWQQEACLKERRYHIQKI